MLEAGADVNVVDCVGLMPLKYVMSNGHDNCVRLLLEAGAEYSGVLILAAMGGHDRIANLLIKPELM